MYHSHSYGKRGGDGSRWRGNHGNSGRRHGGRGPESSHSEEGGGKDRPPPGLTGREIGLWYARRSKAKREQSEKMNRQTVVMDQHKEASIRSLLNNIRAVDNVPPQDSRRFGEVENTDDWWNEGPSTSQSSSTLNALCDSAAESWEDLYEGTKETGDQKQNQSFHPPPASDASPFTSASGFEVGANYSQSSSHQDSQQQSANMHCSDSRQGMSSSSSACAKIENTADEDIYDEELGEEVPQVAALLEYSQAHGDAVYFNETNSDYLLKEEESTSTDMNWLDKQLMKQAQQRLSDKAYLKMIDFRQKLPSYKMKEEIVRLVHRNQVVVISGETGCGKTTQVPQFILDDYVDRGVGSQCHVICTQPRRISAISVGERVAAERCEQCGGENSSVGYQIRLESRQPRRHGSILFCTTGIVLKILEGDPLLKRATHVILDEIHERDILSDFLMIILKDLLPVRPDLKVILMSATLNAEMFSQYFHQCPMINIPGFTYPVQEFLLEDILEMTRYQPDLPKAKQPKKLYRRKDRGKEDEEAWNYSAWLRNLQGQYSQRTISTLQDFDFSKIDLDLILAIICHIVRQKEDGAILVFVPGWEEISNLNKLLQQNPSFRSDRFRIIPLHSLMPTVNQREVFDRPPPGVRKIVIATNIAETSITIDDVVFVIDCGKIKVKDYQAEKNLACLECQWVSRANARQRRGRAGRVQPGYCYHLYTGLKWMEMADYIPPEILRTRLEELCLQIKLLKLGRIEPFVSKAIQPPSMEALHKAIVNLQDLNALDADENLLPLGKHLARMPLEPHTGKMILFGAMFCCLDPILTVAASLSFKDAFVIPLGKEKEADAARKELSDGHRSDHIVLINAMKGWEHCLSRGTEKSFCWKYFLSSSTLRMLRDMKKQLAELLYDLGFLATRRSMDSQANIHADDIGLVKAVLCAGLYPNVAKVIKVPRPGDPPHKMVGLGTAEGKVMVHPKSVNCRETNFPSKWLVYYQILKTTKIYVHDCTMVSPYPLLFFGGSIKIIQDGEHECISVDDWIIFKASHSTAQLVKDLRLQLDRLLEDKIVHPGVTCWNEAKKEGAVMRAISDLISTEEAGGGKEVKSYRRK